MAKLGYSKDVTSGIDVAAWTESNAVPLSTASVSAALAASPSSAVRGTRVELDIPLDLEAEKSLAAERRDLRAIKDRTVPGHGGDVHDDAGLPSGYLRRSEPRRRDSLKRREALLKGKEGSRRRQKWENDHLLGNPVFNPSHIEPQDWAPHPTHRVQHVPYVLAPLWDGHYAKASRIRADKEREAAQAQAEPHQVPKGLREKLRRARGAKGLLQDLEEQVRTFVLEWEDKQRLRSEGWDVDVEESDNDASSEEEVVFVGRKTRGKQKDKVEDDQARRDKLVFDSLVDDHGASFGRWLVHSIASYYNLSTWSITTGNPARREAYVGIPDARVQGRPRSSSSADVEISIQLPRPLYVMV